MPRVAKNRITQRQVATEAGVSEAAVSAVLSGQAKQRRIAEKTVEQVRQAIARLNYQPTRAAAPDKLNHLIGVILKDRVQNALLNPFYGEIFQGMEEVFDREDFSISLAKADDNLQTDRVARLLAQKKVDGLILLGQLSLDNLNWIGDLGMHVVSVNFVAGPNIPSVTFDYAGSRIMAMEYLASRGHTRVAYLSSSLGTQNSKGEEAGYRAGLRSPGEPIVIYAKGGDLDHGQAAVADYLAHRDCNAPLPFTCLLSESDTLAFGAVLALREHGLRVPSDVSVMGGQDLKPNPLCDLPLTTMSLDKVEMGRLAARHLLWKITGESAAAVRIIMPSDVIERDSVATIAG